MLEDIITYFGDLNRNKDYDQWDQFTLNQAPHKPLSILAVMDGIKSGQIQEPRIRLTSKLIEERIIDILEIFHEVLGGSLPGFRCLNNGNGSGT